MTFRLSLAADELCTNVLLHGYARRPGALELRVQASGDAVLLVIRDTAPAFDPNGTPTAAVSEPAGGLEPGGLGLHLVRELVDEMTHRRHPAGNEVVVVTDDPQAE